MNSQSAAVKAPRARKSPRIRDQETTIVSARVPKDQAEWLEEQAALGFRGRGDQLAFLVSVAYHEWKNSEA
jgi:hypothetical protein